MWNRTRLAASLIAITTWVAVTTGCASQPQVVYVPYPQAAPAVQAPPSQPAMAYQDDSEGPDIETLQWWRDLCYSGMSDVDLVVQARNAGYDYTVVNDAMLENVGEQLSAGRHELVSVAGEDAYYAMADLMATIVQSMVQQVYTRPYMSADEEKRLWLQDCLAYMD